MTTVDGAEHSRLLLALLGCLQTTHRVPGATFSSTLLYLVTISEQASTHSGCMTPHLLQALSLGPELPACATCLARFDETLSEAPQDGQFMEPNPSCAVCMAVQRYGEGEVGQVGS